MYLTVNESLFTFLDPACGKTCFFVACQTGLFDDALKMLHNGAKPDIPTNSGDSISSILSLTKLENLTKRLANGGEVILKRQKSAWSGNVYSCQLQVTNLALGLSVASIYDMETGEGCEYVMNSAQKTVLCFLMLHQMITQFSKMRKLKYDIKSSTLTIEKAVALFCGFDQFIQSIEELASEKCAKKNIWNPPPLHSAIENQNQFKINLFSRFFGLKFQAVDESGKSPMQLILESQDFSQNKNDFSWFAIQNGIDSFARTEEEFQNILNVVAEKEISTLSRNLPDLSNTCSFFAKKGDHQSLKVRYQKVIVQEIGKICLLCIMLLKPIFRIVWICFFNTAVMLISRTWRIKHHFFIPYR